MDVPVISTIRPMTLEDLDEVIVIESSSFPRPWTREHFMAELASPFSYPRVACDNEGLVAGYICSTLVVDEGEILDVAVRKDLRGRGVGRALLGQAVHELAALGAAIIRLEVRVSNLEAISLYRRFGFREAGRRKGYYENGEDAILMEFLIENSEDRADAV